MDEKASTVRVAVIGMGPRGLGALEALSEAIDERRFAIDIFDPFPAPGAGPNFDPDESRVCRLNIPIRDISLPPPDGSACGTFADWVENSPDPDTFPTRSDLGRYLEARYAELMSKTGWNISLLPCEATGIIRHADAWQVVTDATRHGPYDEVLMTLGQPPVTPDDQLAEWLDHAARSAGVLAEAYPAHRLERAAGRWQGKTVAIRGFALSTFDVLRGLTTAQGGRFTGKAYVPSGREPDRILPFSLDGRPPFPKPETQALDARFEPTDAETRQFETAIARAAEADPAAARQLITGAILPPAERIVKAHGSPQDAGKIAEWLETEWTDPGTQETEGPLETLHLGLAIAEGAHPPSIGYVVGQLWRKWQNALRAGYNPVPTPRETAKTLLDFDEGLKRYSYGPPVSSSRELAALIAAGLVDLDVVTDPEIDLTAKGWRLSAKGHSAETSVMINAVLPAPDPSAVTAPLVAGLLADGWLSVLADGLAAHTASDGSLIGKTGQTSPGLCLLGRLALGSVIAADSLHDCFGAASQRWAEGVVRRAG